MKNKHTIFFSGLFLLTMLAIPLQAFSAMEVFSGEITLGVWNNSFRKGKAYAEENNIPMLLFWSNPGCGVCADLKSNCGLDKFKEWQAERKIVMVFDEGGGEAKAFARNSSGRYPYICVYWPKKNGETVIGRFSGINLSMPVTYDDDGKYLPVVDQFIQSIELYISDYKPADSAYGRFKSRESAGTRLEVLAGASGYVDVPVYRDPVCAQHANESKVIAEFPDGSAITNDLTWVAGEYLQKLVRVPIPDASEIAAGDEIELFIVDADGDTADESIIAVIDPLPNSSKNPDWLGEEFDFGRWTFDYSAATNAVAEKISSGPNAYTLVLFTGALWCPYCVGIENSLLAPGSKFYEWAYSNNVALAMFDQGRASSPATAAGTMAPRLLTYEHDPRYEEDETVSGAGYLSRHSVAAEEAAAVISNTTYYTDKWLEPETTAKRMSQPTILLVKEDAVVARLNLLRDADRNYGIEENLARLDDLLLLADRDDEFDDYLSTTSLEHSMGGEDAVELQISRRSAFYALSGVSAGRVQFERKDDGAQDVLFSLWSDGELIALGTNSLSAGIAAGVAGVGNFKLGVHAYSYYDDASSTIRAVSEKVFAGGLPTTSCLELQFSSKMVFVPEEGRSETVLSAGANALFEIVKGEKYRLTGFAADSVNELFETEDQENSIFTAKEGGTVPLKVGETGEIGYQLWHPGTISFDPVSYEVEESAGEVKLAVCREGGSSGAVKVKVALDVERSNSVVKERYSWEDVEIEWADGESGIRTATLSVNDDVVYDGDQKLYFLLAKTEAGVGVEIVDDESAVTITENDEKIAGRLALTGAAPDFASKRTIIAVENTKVQFTVERIEGAEGVATAVLGCYGAEGAESWGAGENMQWKHHDRDTKRTAELKLPSIEQCPSGFVTVSLVSGDIGVDPARKDVKITLISQNAPVFATNELEVVAVQNVSFADQIAIMNNSGTGTVKIVKVSGIQPAGVTVNWDPATETVMVSGVAKTAGEYVAVYRVFEEFASSQARGGTVTVRYSVVDPVSAGLNESVAECRTFKSVAMISPLNEMLAGTMTVTVPSSGKVSLKYASGSGDVSMTASNWTQCDEDGTLVAEASNRDGTYKATVYASADGSVTVEMSDPAYPGDILNATFGTVPMWGSDNTAADYAGLYTVACEPTAYTHGGAEMVAWGAVIISLKVSGETSLKNGRVRYYGYLPNGKSFSGSAVLTPSSDGESAMLPICYSSDTDSFTAMIEIARGAKETYEVSGASNPKLQRVITGVEGIVGKWTHRCEKSSLGDFVVTYGNTYGSYYDPEQDFAESLVKSEVMPTMTLKFDTTDFVPSHVYGDIGEIEDVEFIANGNNLSASGMTFNKSKGFVIGSALLPFSGADTPVRANYRGIVLPGWTGCGCSDYVDLPYFMIGSCYFADKFVYENSSGSCTEIVAQKIPVPVKRSIVIRAETKAYIQAE